MKVHLTKIHRGEIETKYGKKEKIGIKTEEYENRWLTSFNVRGTENWQEGNVVNISVEQKGQYLNFRFPLDKIDLLEERVEALENFMLSVEKGGVVKELLIGDPPEEDLSPNPTADYPF